MRSTQDLKQRASSKISRPDAYVCPTGPEETVKLHRAAQSDSVDEALPAAAAVLWGIFSESYRLADGSQPHPAD